MKRVKGIFCAAVAALMGIQTAEALTLAKDGKTVYTIVVADDAIMPEKTAADRLQFYLREITGAEFPVVTEAKANMKRPRILVGPSKAVKALLPNVKWESLGYDGIVIKTAGDDLVLAGGRPRGTLYAVYTFLEDTVGCRWWSSRESTIPQKPTLALEPLDTIYVPPLMVREHNYRDIYKNEEFQVQLKLNGQWNGISEKFGGHVYFIPDLVHTFYRLLPPEKYFAQHPEWYSELDGKRTAAGESQLCLTNHEMRKEIVKNILALLRKDKNARLVSLSQNDTFGGYCRCATCKALDAREGSPAGSLVTFVNAAAAEIEKEFPAVMIETLAYNYSRPVPKYVRPRPNVIIRIVGGVGCSYEHPHDSEFSQSFRDAARGWSRIAPNLFFWDYTTNFSNFLVPHPNLQVQAPNIRFFVRCHAKGIFQQGDDGSMAGDFIRLRAWINAHLMWNPNLDEQKLLLEFLDGYYGPAAPYLAQYLALIEKSFLAKNIRLSSSGSNLAYMKLSEMNQATRLFDQAEKAVAGNKILADRVNRERLVLDHLWLLRYADLKKLGAMKKQEFLGPADPIKAMEDFFQRVTVRHDNQNRDGGMADLGTRFVLYEPKLRALLQPVSVPSIPPTECKGLRADQWVDLQDNRFNLPGAGTVRDDQASDKSAAQPLGAWGVMVPLSGDLIRFWPGKWKIYVTVRIESKTKSGVAFDYGLYDYGTKNEPTINVRFDQIPDEKYHTYEVATEKLNYNKCLWVSKREADKVYVDRIFLIPEAAKTNQR